MLTFVESNSSRIRYLCHYLRRILINFEILLFAKFPAYSTSKNCIRTYPVKDVGRRKKGALKLIAYLHLLSWLS